VSVVIKEAEIRYLKLPGRKGQQRRGTTLRILSVSLRESEKDLYPKDWEKELEKYYKNLSQLK